MIRFKSLQQLLKGSNPAGSRCLNQDVLCVCVCVEHLKRCKTSFSSMMVDFRGFSLLNHICRGMECASDVSIQRRRICCTVIWIGDAQSTYLLIFVHGNRPSQEPACRFVFNFFSAQLPQSAYSTIFMIEKAASKPSSEQGRRKFTSH